MSQENVELVKSLYAAFFQRDMEFIKHHLALDFEARQSVDLPWGGKFRGIDGLAEFFRKLTTHLDNRALPIERYLDAGDHVVAIGRTQGFVRSNGKPFDVPLAHIWQIENGKAKSFRPFIDNPTMRASLV